MPLWEIYQFAIINRKGLAFHISMSYTFFFKQTEMAYYFY